LHQTKLIHEDATIYHLTLLKTVDHYTIDHYLVASGRNAQKVTSVGAAPGEATPKLVPFGGLFFGGPLKVRESSEKRSEELF
jgi:hypothetical protein